MAASERSKCLGVYFQSLLYQTRICGSYFYASWRKGETCRNLVLQLIIFCNFRHILLSVVKSNFHFKRKSKIYTDSFNDINVSILQCNIVFFQIKKFIILERFLWKSFSPICGVVMNIIGQLTYTNIHENFHG